MADLKPHVIIIPFPAQGHVIPTLELSQCLVNQGVKVTFINTEVTQKLVTRNWLDHDEFGDLMQMVSIPDGLELLDDRSDLGKLILSILETMPGKLEELIEIINKEESNKIKCVIADANMGWAIRVAKNMGIRSAAFWPASVTTLAPILCYKKLIEDGIINEKGIPISEQTIRLSETMPPIKLKNLLVWTCIEDVATVEALFKMLVDVEEAYNITPWFICNSTTEIEAAAFSLYPKLLQIGPLLASNRLTSQAGNFWQEDPSCLAWLDQKPERSVIYIAFGSFTIFNQTQFEELALGLELTNQTFLWVVRPGMTKETSITFPDGYIDRSGEAWTKTPGRPDSKCIQNFTNKGERT